MSKPYLAVSELTHTIYIVNGKEKYDVTEQAIKAVERIEALKQPVVAENTTSDYISRDKAIENVAQIAKAAAKSDKQKSLCGRIIFMLEHMSEEKE